MDRSGGQGIVRHPTRNRVELTPVPLFRAPFPFRLTADLALLPPFRDPLTRKLTALTRFSGRLTGDRDDPEADRDLLTRR